MNATVLYNPQCATCRKVKEALESKGFTLILVEYLKAPPSMDELDAICQKMGVEPQAIAREKEEVYADVALRCKTRRDWLQALHENPVLIQRPIVVIGEKALIARPPEALDSWRPFLK